MHKLFMRKINTWMKTYTALIKVQVGTAIRAVATEVRAASSVDAKWLLQAVYGFHAIVSGPTESVGHKPTNQSTTKR